MITIHLEENKSICHVKPSSALQADDFLQLASIIDSYIAQHGELKGLVIETLTFPGWENTDAFMAHMRFIKNHQAKIKKIALVTDSVLAVFVEKVIGHFMMPKIKHFPFGQVALAEQWINA